VTLLLLEWVEGLAVLELLLVQEQRLAEELPAEVEVLEEEVHLGLGQPEAVLEVAHLAAEVVLPVLAVVELQSQD
jgi:hypothetical protein